MPDVLRLRPADRPGGGPWTVVLPLKGGPSAKSRLGGPPALATALALDCLDAVLASPATGRVLVVTGDPELASAAVAAGAHPVPEGRLAGGLDAAVRAGLAAAPATGPVAVLLGDLPALRPDDVSAGLGIAGGVLAARPAPRMVVVPDADGVGSVLLAGRRRDDLEPAFGPGSLAAHERLGARAVSPDLPRLRRDVDTPADLDVAVALGVGPRTARVLRRTASACGTALQ